MANFRSIIVGVATAALLPVFSSCGRDNSDGMESWDQANQEYHKTITSFPFSLPSGVSFPTDLSTSNDAAAGRYQTGYGDIQAYFFAECAHLTVAMNTKDKNSSQAHAALGEVKKIVASDVYQQHVSDADGGYQAAINKALLGDYSVLSQFYSSDCDSDWFKGKET